MPDAAQIPMFSLQGLQGQLGVARYSRNKRFRQTLRRWLGKIGLPRPVCPAEPSQDGKFLIVRSSHSGPGHSTNDRLADHLCRSLRKTFDRRKEH